MPNSVNVLAGTSTKAFLRGVETWKKETVMKKVFHSHRLLPFVRYNEYIKNDSFYGRLHLFISAREKMMFYVFILLVPCLKIFLVLL